MISAGCTLDGAARYVGCAPSTIRREALRNPDFSERLRRADLATEISLLQAIRKAASKYWRAAVWLLEHSDPQRFGRQPIHVLKPEVIKAYASLVGLVLADEIRDPDLLRRINKRLDQICLHATREGEAAARDPFYPKQPRLPAIDEVAPSPASDDDRRHAEHVDEQESE